MRSGLDPARQAGMEIGALASPLVSKSEGTIIYIDHCEAAALRETYKDDPNVDVSRIVEIDAVWGEQSLADCVGGATFDYVLASHVAEHVPDLVGWLQEVRGVLRPQGQLRLALPDCRFSFDALRDETRLVDLLTNWVLRARRPQVHNVLDFRLHYAPEMDGVAAYEGRFDQTRLKPEHAFEVAIESAGWARDLPDQYFDVHCWVFQPRSFVRLMAQLADHGLLPFACTGIGDSVLPLLEFYVFLMPCDDPAQAAATWRAAESGLQGLLPGPPAAIDRRGRGGITNLTQELAAARQALAKAEARIAGLEASMSWRITAPIRWLRRRAATARGARIFMADTDAPAVARVDEIEMRHRG